MRWLNTILRWLAAVVVTVIAASLVHSWTIQRGLSNLGIDISAGLGLRTAAADFAGLAPALFVVLGTALAVGFIVAAVLNRYLNLPRWVAFPLAGGVAVGVTLALMYLRMQITPIASAREPLGFIMLCLAGALGGWVFVITKRR
ncbi:hypothetical protein GCM10011529_19730 [Polymorphobacter glacialis]|uniref:Transmembrane protein n=1 Tax=Sandarakinorhabdus glacialis TaxID=1614636 RepID=A0A916ZUH7_9SPHN|nr:hypothetical protein [Polymorphobacter glacialis]GGE13409.1 hypothetical protein GCM10011529_19730 [Polymorphobacter glacialis]